MLKSLKFHLLITLLSSVFILNSSCVSSVNVSDNDSVAEDGDYSDAYDDATRMAQVYKDFESKYHITVTYLSPKYRSAFTKRLQGLFVEGQPSLDEAGNKAGFFVSIHAPDDKTVELSDSHLWNIFLETSDNRHNPTFVRRINQKLRWQPFFPKISKWTKEYLILFDTPSVSTNQKEMVKKSSLNLTFASADAQVKMSW